MAFTDAIFDGQATLEGLRAQRVDQLTELAPLLLSRAAVPVMVLEFTVILEHVKPDVLVDARMRKRARPEDQRGVAPFTIGLGPNFVAGQNTDVVIETSWGEELGKIIYQGESKALAGQPRVFGGHSRDRFIYAPEPGHIRTDCRIGDRVVEGQVVAYLDDRPLLAPLAGILRGLAHDGVPVQAGAKVIEVDPRGDPAYVFGLGERPGRIGDGVVKAVSEWHDRLEVASPT